MGGGTISVDGPPQPYAWGRDRLSAFLEAAQRNQIATFANKEERFAQLRAIDDCYMDVISGWKNPSQPMVAMLFIRTLGAYRAAVGQAMAGACADTFVSIRTMLEAAGYAAHINQRPELEEIWLRRHDDEKSLAETKSEFTVAKVRTSIKARDRHTAERFDRLYQDAIDFGAHPNERSITGNMDRVDMGGETAFNQLLLQGDGVALDHALISTARAGLCSLDILRIPYAARFALLGVQVRVLQLRKGL